MSGSIRRFYIRHLLLAWVATGAVVTILAIALEATDSQISSVEDRHYDAIRDSIADNLRRLQDSVRVWSAEGQSELMIRPSLESAGLQDSSFSRPTAAEVRRIALLQYGAWYPALALVLFLPLVLLLQTARSVSSLHGGQLGILSALLLGAIATLSIEFFLFQFSVGDCLTCKTARYLSEYAVVAALLLACVIALVGFWWSWFGRRGSSGPT